MKLASSVGDREERRRNEVVAYPGASFSFGSLIALPLQKGPREVDNSVFLDERFMPYSDQWARLPTYHKNAVAEHNLADDVREITRFFDAVGICIQEDLCDAEVVKSKLCYEARSFFRLHYVFLSRERELLSYPSHASATEQLANELCPSS